MNNWKYVIIQVIFSLIQIVIVPLIIVPLAVAIFTGQEISASYLKLIELLKML